MLKKIFEDNKKYTFSDYFEMRHTTSDIAAALGYSFSFEVIDLPRDENYDRHFIEILEETFYTVFPKISFNSEMAKREFLVAPLLLEIARTTNIQINVEYALNVNQQLSGLLDYFLVAEQSLIIIEAKRKDIDAGFNQLVAELIALDQSGEDQNVDCLYGAVTLGDLWKFGCLDRKQKRIIKNINSHTIPKETADVFSILMGIIHRK